MKQNMQANEFRLIDTGWDAILKEAIKRDGSNVQVICPFIKRRSAERLLANGIPKSLQVITRFNLDDFYNGVSDVSALRLLLANGAMIRGVKHLHAKLYLFGDRQAIVTSANLTEAALLRNHEFGFIAEDVGIVSRCCQYFDALWKCAEPNLTTDRMDGWERKINNRLAKGVRLSTRIGLGDEGVDAGLTPEPVELPIVFSDAPQAFVKFFGDGHNRADRSKPVFDQVKSSGCHWACTYPKDKRPRKVQDGAIMFMGRLVKEPNDILIYGRAIAMHYEKGRDDASAVEILVRSWKNKWPHYIRVHHPEFVAGILNNGVSLNELMKSLQHVSFATTQRNALQGKGNVNPRKSYMRQPAVELSREALSWLNDRLQLALEKYGSLPPASLEKLN